MYEREVDCRRRPANEVPLYVIEKFRSFRQKLAGRYTIRWAAHCIQCALPDCYSKCEFYAPRSDLKCRRFADGIVTIFVDDDPDLELMEITSKKRGRMEGPAVRARYRLRARMPGRPMTGGLPSSHQAAPRLVSARCIRDGGLQSGLAGYRSSARPAARSEGRNGVFLAVKLVSAACIPS